MENTRLNNPDMQTDDIFIKFRNVTFSYAQPNDAADDDGAHGDMRAPAAAAGEPGLKGADNVKSDIKNDGGTAVESGFNGEDIVKSDMKGDDCASDKSDIKGYGGTADDIFGAHGVVDVYDRDKAVEDVTFNIKRGEFVVFLGRNGSGKSTLAKLLNALIFPDSGVVTVKNMDTSDPEHIWEIRRTSGMVFQNPDNQIVGTTVEEDVAFGVENLGVPPDEIRARIDASMAATGISEFTQRPPYQLSGGQKQRVAIAGILAMKPECVILDEATSMLDPDGRREVLNLVRKLNKEDGIAVILITHHMDEAAFADRVFVVDEGRVTASNTPRELFGDSGRIKSIGLDVPQITGIFEILRERGFTGLPSGVTNIDEAYDALAPLLKGGNS